MKQSMRDTSAAMKCKCLATTRVESWRQWARFVFTNLHPDAIASMSDEELQAAVCEHVPTTAAIVTMITDAYGDGQHRAIEDANAGLIDDLIEPRLKRERAQ